MHRPLFRVIFHINHVLVYYNDFIILFKKLKTSLIISFNEIVGGGGGGGGGVDVGMKLATSVISPYIVIVIVWFVPE